MKNKNGFTLIELLAVVVIVCLLVGVASFSVTKIVQNSQRVTNETLIRNVKDAALSYFYDNGKSTIDINNDGCKTSSESESSINNLSSSCKSQVTIETLISQGYLKGDVKRLNLKENTTVYVYKDPKNAENIEYRVYVNEKALFIENGVTSSTGRTDNNPSTNRTNTSSTSTSRTNNTSSNTSNNNTNNTSSNNNTSNTSSTSTNRTDTSTNATSNRTITTSSLKVGDKVSYSVYGYTGTINSWIVIKAGSNPELVAETSSPLRYTITGEKGWLNLAKYINLQASSYKNNKITSARNVGYRAQTLTCTSQSSCSSENQYLTDTNAIKNVIGTLAASGPSQQIATASRGTSSGYWLPSRYSYATGSKKQLYAYHVINSSVTSTMLYDNGKSVSISLGIRPIITLASNVTFDSTGRSSGYINGTTYTLR